MAMETHGKRNFIMQMVNTALYALENYNTAALQKFLNKFDTP